MLKYIKEKISYLLLFVLRKLMTPTLFTSFHRKKYSGEKIIILHHNYDSTLYYYFISRINKYNAKSNIIFINTLNEKIKNYNIFNNSFVIVVRYVPLSILLKIKKSNYINLIYFLDDNIPAAFTDTTLPPIYSLKTTFQFYSIRRTLSKMRVSILFSTKNIYKYYEKYGGKIIRPLNIYKNYKIKNKIKKYSICYLGTSSHIREYQFVASKKKIIQNNTSNVSFFVINSIYNRKLFRDIPRVYFINVSKMSDYIYFLEHYHFDIGLSPLFVDSTWNSGKSNVKIFEITTNCSYGIFSKNKIYYPFAIKKHNNLLFLENIEYFWIKEIFDIINVI